MALHNYVRSRLKEVKKSATFRELSLTQRLRIFLILNKYGRTILLLLLPQALLADVHN